MEFRFEPEKPNKKEREDIAKLAVLAVLLLLIKTRPIHNIRPYLQTTAKKMKNEEPGRCLSRMMRRRGRTTF